MANWPVVKPLTNPTQRSYSEDSSILRIFSEDTSILKKCRASSIIKYVRIMINIMEDRSTRTVIIKTSRTALNRART